MNTILFLGRTGTARQYALMAPYLKNVEIVFVAYAQKAVDIWATYNIKPDYVYLDLFREEYDNCIVNEKELSEIDADLIEQSKGRFNLNSSMQSDRGFTLLTYEESLRSAVAHYRVWKRIFSEHHVDVMAHEPCSLFFNHIASVLCKKQGGVYCYDLAAKSDKYDYAYLIANNDDFDYSEIKYLYAKYLSSPELIDKQRCEAFLTKFRGDFNVFMGNIMNRKKSLISLLWTALRNYLSFKIKTNKSDRIYDNINYFLASNNVAWNKIKNIIGYKIEKIKYVNEIPANEKFLFYPMHLEPEAVVLYLADGIYKNQTKLIENIAASLPAGYYLYVKDHPHSYAYRDAIDYKRLLKVPNIRLLNQSIPAKTIIAQAQGVVTLNGTAGFEAMLMGKQAYCFGQNMYSFMTRIHKVKNIRDLRQIIYDSIDVTFQDDDNLMAYIMAYLESCHPGYTSCYTGGPVIQNIDYNENARLLAEEMMDYLAFCKKRNEN